MNKNLKCLIKVTLSLALILPALVLIFVGQLFAIFVCLPVYFAMYASGCFYFRRDPIEAFFDICSEVFNAWRRL